jgi:hypothetical protein
VSVIIKLWESLPIPIRGLVSAGVQKCGVSAPALHKFFGLRHADRFYSLSPDTVPAITKSLELIKTRALTGDYYEFGLYRGYIFGHAQRTALKLGLSDMHFFGFDSFEGLPPPKGIDSEFEEFKEGDYACSLEQVSKNLTKFGFDWSKAKLIKGFFDQSLTPEIRQKHDLRPVTVALIDCDLYASTVPVLNFLRDLLQEGSILLFDDWNCYNGSDEMGQRKAFREFLSVNAGWRAEEYVSFGWHGQGFVMHRR